jgi:putative SOS response-associated peptidase YedK
MGWLEEFKRAMGKDVLHSDNDSKCRELHSSRPDASDPVSDSYDLWLDSGVTDMQFVSELLKPYDARVMRSYPVSTRVNHVANDDDECSRPMVIADRQNRIFA